MHGEWEEVKMVDWEHRSQESTDLEISLLSISRWLSGARPVRLMSLYASGSSCMLEG